MKNIDVSESVMKKIARFEKSRSSTWLGGFYAGIGVMALLIGVFFWMSIQTISDFRGWDLLTIFTQDREIIRDYWQETIGTFLSELPIETIIIALGVLVLLIIIVIITRKRRKVYEYRMRELAKRVDIRKNSK